MYRLPGFSGVFAVHCGQGAERAKEGVLNSLWLSQSQKLPQRKDIRLGLKDAHKLARRAGVEKGILGMCGTTGV